MRTLVGKAGTYDTRTVEEQVVIPWESVVQSWWSGGCRARKLAQAAHAARSSTRAVTVHFTGTALRATEWRERAGRTGWLVGRLAAWLRCAGLRVRRAALTAPCALRVAAPCAAGCWCCGAAASPAHPRVHP
ncbi:hypothetical protein O0L34_g11714 [Tuta absoluta]|nr:hypothetical protein O0L34_g11714 [Tuta absoluta]